MGRASLPVLSHYLRRLTARYGDSSTDRDLLQRFVAHREDSAFAALVERHAAMVLRLCRSILSNHHDAEDIFQAVFLVLARKAGSIRKGESLGSWLYAVAYRLAHKARVRTGKRRICEKLAALPPEQTPMDDITWGELRDILHEEVSRLPEKYRAVVVLCYWDGRTHEQAGQQLGCAKSTIKDRLERAREMLRTRLARRGLALSAAWFAAALSEGTSMAVSVELVQTTVRGALAFSMGQLPEGLVSAKAVACAKGALQTMLVGKLKYGLALVVMLGMLTGVAGVTAFYMAAPEDEPEALATATAPENEPEALATEEPLPAGAVVRLGTLRFRHSDPISRIGIGADGTSILSSAGKAVYVWDIATGKERRRFQHETPVRSFVWSRDGKLLASGCEDGTIRFWDLSGGRCLHLFSAHQGKAPDWRGWWWGALVIGFTPDSRRLVSTGSDNTICLWDVEKSEQIREFGRFTGVGEVTLSPDGKTLAGVVKDKTWELRLWDVATGRERKRKSLADKRILSPVFSPHGKYLAIAVGGDDWLKPCEIQLWDAEAEKKIHTLQGHKGWTRYTFSPDGKMLISSCNENGARLWDVATGKEIGRIGNDFVCFSQLLFCPDGRTLVSCTPNHHGLRFWDRVSGKEIRSSGDALTPIDFLSFSPDGRLLAIGSKTEWDFRLWDMGSRKKLRRFEHGSLIALGFSPDGGRLASAAFKDPQARIWDAASGKELRRITTNQGDKFIDVMAWSGDGRILATWGAYHDPIRLWNSQTGQQLRALSADIHEIGALLFSPDGKTLTALGTEVQPQGSKTLILRWSVETGKQLSSIETSIRFVNTGGFGYPRLAFSRDGRTLAAGGPGAKESISLWEAATGRRRLTLDHGEDVDSLAFSPDGKFLAAAINLNYFNELARLPDMAYLRPGNKSRPRVHLWDLTTNTELPPLEGHQGAFTALAFSPDGKLLATGGNDTTVLFWDATRFQTKRPSEVELPLKQLESLWTDLGGEDAAKAYHAIRTMAAAPKSSVAFLKRHLQPVAPVDAKEMARLLADLDSEQFGEREKAMQQLEKLGDRAAMELRKAMADKPSPEAKRRIEQLLGKQNIEEHIRMVRALETLECLGTPEARELCATLATGVPDAPLTREARATLQRMTR